MCSRRANSLEIKERICGSQPFGNVVALMGNMLSLRWGKSWLEMQSPGISRGFRSMCFVSGQWKERRWQQDGQHSLRRECSESANKCVHGKKSQTDWIMFQDSEAVGRSGWFNECVSGVHLKRCSHEHRSCCYVIQRLYTPRTYTPLFLVKVWFWRFERMFMGFMYINTSVNKRGCGFER